MSGIRLYDTTLRDGTQRQGVSLSVEDKLKIARKLDELGIDFIEGGWPGANPKDEEFFQQAKSLSLKHATIVAFGSTRRAKGRAEDDPNLRELIKSEAPVLTLVGKSSDFHVSHVLETSLEENLAMIYDSVAYLRSQGRRVIFDAEHFFDGYKANPEYAVQCVRSAADAGAECVTLCDTNGGTLPHEVAQIVERVVKEVPTEIGIHTHNDADVAVAGALAAVQVGAGLVQGTANGYGERCGNANIFSIIANLKLKMGIDCVTDNQVAHLTEAHRYISEVANMPPDEFQAFVGLNAFTHKAGLHASAVAKVKSSYEHIQPESVGNSNQVLVSELAGRSNVASKLKEMGLDAEVPPLQARALLDLVKERESKGFQYEDAEASFELLVRRGLEGYRPPMELVNFMVRVDKRPDTNRNDGNDVVSEAMVKVQVGGETMHTAADGNGPVNALDNALRKALLRFYPSLQAVRLVDYKVRVVDQGSGTKAIVRVLIESTDGEHFWRTVGASPDIIEASWIALTDSLEYWLAKWSA